MALAIVAAYLGYRWMVPSAPVEYVTAPVTRGDIVQAVIATGTVNPVVTVQVGTYVSGPIVKMVCDFNTEVKKGQLCAKIDPRPYQLTVDQAQANLANGKAQLQKDQASLVYAKITYEREPPCSRTTSFRRTPSTAPKAPTTRPSHRSRSTAPQSSSSRRR